MPQTLAMARDDLRRALDLLASAAPPSSSLEPETHCHVPPELACRSVALLFAPNGTLPALDLRGRYIAALAANSALGAGKSRDLRETVRIARSIGLTRDEITEAVFQPAFLGAFASSIGALRITVEVFAAEDAGQ